MIFLIVLAMFDSALSTDLDRSLTEWKPLKDKEERVMFPLRGCVLEIKSLRPDAYNSNPSYGELFRTDQATAMMMLLYAGSWNNKVGRYDRGFDINLGEKATKLWDLLPREVNQEPTLSSFKLALGDFLKQFPDNPLTKGYVTSNNSPCLHWALIRGTEADSGENGVSE